MPATWGLVKFAIDLLEKMYSSVGAFEKYDAGAHLLIFAKSISVLSDLGTCYLENLYTALASDL